MKKAHIAALAASAALTPLFAAAQTSSVTFSGAVDAYLLRAKGSLTTNTQMASGGNSTSRLIVRGTEDLGGGLRAGFWLEGGFTLNNGISQAITNVDNAGANQATGPWGRRAIVSLAGTWGELQMGRNWSPAYDVFTGRFDVFGVGSGIALNYGGSINNTIVRVSNSTGYTTPRLGPVAANVQHWRGNPNGDGKGSGIRLHFDQGKFGAVAHYAKTNLSAGDAEFKGIAAIYNFGSFTVTGNYQTAERGVLEQEGGLIGLRVPLGAHEAKASYSWIETNATAASPKSSKIAVGYVYNLSRRTAIYTTLAAIDNRNGATLAITGSTTAPGKSSTGVDLGLRHSF
jgi:predicted porin